jgi:hypothetical protein
MQQVEDLPSWPVPYLVFFFFFNLLGKGMKETDQDRVKHLEKKFDMKIQQGLKMKLVPSCKIRAY